MSREVRARFWIELALLVGTVALMIVTLIWRDWIEIVFGIDPDEGSGSLEWLMVAASAGLTLVLVFVTSTEWRRLPRVERTSGDGRT